MLLAALLVAGLWQDAAMDFVFYIAAALALHGAGVLAALFVYAFRFLNARAQFAARLCGILAIVACIASAACFAGGLGVMVWGGMTVLVSDSGDDSGSRSVPLGWTRS
jgi:hypothetical protein